MDELHSPTFWIVVVGGLLLQLGGALIAYTKLSGKVEEIAKSCEKTDERIDSLKKERDGQMSEMKREIDLRMTKIESTQGETQELLYRKMESMSDGINRLQGDFNKLQGYIQAKEEFEKRPARRGR